MWRHFHTGCSRTTDGSIFLTRPCRSQAETGVLVAAMSSVMFVILEWLNMEFENNTTIACDLQTESESANFWTTHCIYRLVSCWYLNAHTFISDEKLTLVIHTFSLQSQPKSRQQFERAQWGRKESYSSKSQSCVNAKSHRLSATAGKPGTVGKY